jgi:hypothetical protein
MLYELTVKCLEIDMDLEHCCTQDERQLHSGGIVDI